MTDKSVRVFSHDRSTSVELALDRKSVRLEMTNPALGFEGGVLPVALTFQTDLADPKFDAPWRSLRDTALGLSRDPDDMVRLQWLGQRGLTALTSTSRRLVEVVRWLLASQETTNHTYALSEFSKVYLAHAVALATNITVDAAAAYIREAEADAELAGHVAAARAQIPPERRALSDPVVRFGRRLGWYAVVRALKPALVVETGVDKGLGAVILCAALLRNRAEGCPGRYLGVDINPHAGYLLSGAYADVGQIAYGDSLETLAKIAAPLGVFINDSDHAAGYEAREYETVRAKLAPGAVILGDNAGSAPTLADFAAATGRKFLFWREQPLDHWYPGGGIGFAFEGR